MVDLVQLFHTYSAATFSIHAVLPFRQCQRGASRIKSVFRLLLLVYEMPTVWLTILLSCCHLAAERGGVGGPPPQI